MPVSVKSAAKQPPAPKIQPGPTEQPPTQKSTEIITKPTPPKPIQVQQKKEEEPYQGETPTVPVIEKRDEKIPQKQLTRTPSRDKTPPQKPKDIRQSEVNIEKNEKASVTEPTKPLPDTPQKTTPSLQVSKQAEGGPNTESAETSLSRTQEKKHMTEIPVEAQSLKKPIQVETVKEKPTKGSQSGTPSGTQKKVKRTLPNPPPEEDTAENQSGYTTVGSVSRRRICRTNTMARAKILQDIDRELDLVERESSKLRKKQAELDEEEKEIDAKLRYLEMGINRRKDALLKEREKRERAYLQGVAEERDYMSDSEISNIRGTRVDSQHGLERPRTAPQSEFDQFMPPQTQPESQYAEHTSPYTQYQYVPPSLPTQAPSQYPQQTHYQQQSLYHQQISPYQTQPSYSSVPTISYPQAPLPQSQQPNYQHPSQMLLMQKPRQTTLADLEPKITTNYELIRNQPLMIVPSSTETTYAVPHMGSKYSNLDLRIGLDERSSMVSSPISNISADSFYADIEQHTPRNYVLIDDIGELTKGSTSMSSTFNIPDKDLTKTDRLLRTGTTDFNLISKAYPLRREETDWFDKPRESRIENGHALDRRLPERMSHSKQSQHQQGEAKPIQYSFPYSKIKLQKDPKDHSVSGNGLGIRVVGGKDIPGNNGEIGAYIAKILPGGTAEQTGKVVEVGISKSVISAFEKSSKDLNMLSDSKNPEYLELHDQTKAAERQRSPGVDPKQLAAELQKVSQQQAPSSVISATEKGTHIHSGTPSAASSAVPSPGQPGSPSVSKKRHSSKPAEASKSHSHPITGEIQLQVNYDKHLGNLIVHVLQARNLAPRDNNGYSDPFVKVYLLPGRGLPFYSVDLLLGFGGVVNIFGILKNVENKRRTKYVQKSLDPEWNQTVIYKNIHMEQVLIDLSNTSHLDSTHRWYPLKEQSESIDHGKSHSGQSSQQSPKPSVSKSRSHGIFPDPSKDMQVPTIEKSHSSPGSSKSSSEGHLRSHGPSRSQSKTSVTQTHLEDAGAAIAAAEAAVQQLRLQPTRSSHRATDSSVSTGSSISSFGSGYSVDSEGSATAGENNIFPAPRMGKTIPNGSEKQQGLGLSETEGKTQIMGEIKIALKKEMKTEGEQLVVEILQCRNITYKFKSPDHLPDLYVKLYVINVATQKRVIKKKTRVCRHDREPSFNETFSFSMNPAGHSIQMFLVSNGGKFMKKTLIGEAYIWLDKVDLRKKVVNWHKLLVSSTQSHP
ncbi:UNVERIFIED_CONTAM: hypothetical protein FKN15_050992 [Acipenser sinensis]